MKEVEAKITEAQAKVVVKTVTKVETRAKAEMELVLQMEMVITKMDKTDKTVEIQIT